MAVEVIAGRNHACMFCTTSDFAFGPVAYGPGAAGEMEDFRKWFYDGKAVVKAETLDLPTSDIRFGDGRDPREWSEDALERLWLAFRAEFYPEDAVAL